MAFRLVCPAFGPDVIGHGTAAGYSAGGAYDHATRCATMGDLLRSRDIDVDTRAARRGIETEDDFFAAIVAKSAAKSEPVAASAAEPVETVTIDGVTYRKA